MSALYFKYQAFDAQGKVLTGQLSADTEREAVRILKGKNLTPVKIQETKEAAEKIRRKRISQSDVLDFTNGLCTLVEARVPIDRSLRLLEGITESSAMRELVVNLHRLGKAPAFLHLAQQAHNKFTHCGGFCNTF